MLRPTPNPHSIEWSPWLLRQIPPTQHTSRPRSDSPLHQPVDQPCNDHFQSEECDKVAENMAQRPAVKVSLIVGRCSAHQGRNKNPEAPRPSKDHCRNKKTARRRKSHQGPNPSKVQAAEKKSY